MRGAKAGVRPHGVGHHTASDASPPPIDALGHVLTPSKRLGTWNAWNGIILYDIQVAGRPGGLLVALECYY